MTAKLERVTRHFDHVIDVNVVLSVDKLQAAGRRPICTSAARTSTAECVDPDMYAAIDALADKLDRQVLRHKEKTNGQRHEPAAIKRTASARCRASAPCTGCRAAL